MECPLLVWMLSLNRDTHKAEYDLCYNLVKECAPHTAIPYAPTNVDSFRQIMTAMLPLLMMRHRRISRAKWRDCVTSTGKHWIEQSPDDMPPEKFLQSMIGYHLAYDNSLCGMVMTQGRQRQVINIGLGIKQIAVEPRGATVAAYAESHAHKLTPLELTFISSDQPDDVVLRRLCILLALKQAYIKAIGQPIGFDLSRLEFNIPEETARGDDHPLDGWEFRVFKSQLGVGRTDRIVEESYQCACAFFRGSKESKFVWHDNQKDLETWVQFINIDQMVKVIPKLTA
jgi:4'-phosphopantetheinyl transferase